MKDKITKVEFTNLKKILFLKMQITKAQIIEYYIKVAPRMLAFLTDRPLALTRFPNGIEKQGFYEKNAPQGTPTWIKTIKVFSKTAKRGTNYVLCNDLDTLVWLANLATIEIHTPLSRVDSLKKPDLIFFDIDPEPPATYQKTAEVTLLLKEKLDNMGLESFVKTSGKKGFHVVIPIIRKYTFLETRKFVHKIGKQLAKEDNRIVSELTETKKPGKIFVDYLQNSHGRTMVSPYSLRAVPEATVSNPLDWKDLKKGIKPTDLNIFNVGKSKKDPWKRILERRQKLLE